MPSHRPPVPTTGLIEPHQSTPPPQNRLLGLLDAYQRDPASLSADQALTIKVQLQLLARHVDDERLDFSEARYIDSDTVCMVFMGEPGGLCALPTRANLLIDQNWNLSGGIVFRGLRAEAVRLC